jgi:hypothetical protein
MRTTRETVTISLTYKILSDTDDNKPVPSPPHQGDQPTRVYQGSYPMGDEDLSKIRAGVLKRLEAVFPIGSGGDHLEFESAETTKVE